MPSFTVEQETKLSKADAYQKVQDYLRHSEGLKKLDSDLQYSFDDASHTGQIKGSKFECQVKITGDSPTKVVLQISIPLLLSPFKGKIQETLQGKMSQLLG
jgi:hypothetical protein